MVWKPKEKELTREEAVALATKELAPFWHGCPPLFAAARGSVFPLDPKFHSQSWMLLFTDPLLYSGESTLQYAIEMYKRYSPHNLNFCIVLRATHAFQRDPKSIEQLMRRNHIQFPVVIDWDGGIWSAFSVQELPRMVVLRDQRTVLNKTGPDWNKGTELEIQSFLRTSDPGLSLRPVWEPPVNFAKDAGRLDFGRKRGVVFPGQGFTMPEAGFGVGHFVEAQAPKAPPKDLRNPLAIRGNWLQDLDCIATSDPTAEISFFSPSTDVSVIAQTLSKIQEPARLIIEINGERVPDMFMADDLDSDDDGNTLVRLELPKLYHAVKKLPFNERQIRFRFPFANRSAVSLYGVRFGTSS